MLTSNDLTTVYDFIKATGENNIRQMMTNSKMTALHVGVLLKIVRTSKVEDFIKCYETQSFPKVKFSGPETALKETFWPVAADTFVQLGLVSVQKAA